VTALDAAGTESTQTGTPPTATSVVNPLDRRLDLGRLGWLGIAGGAILIAAFVLRFTQLDAYMLSQREGEWANDAWSLYTGKPLPVGQDLPLVSPLFLMLEAAAFFLFGVNDVIARAMPALAGIGIVALVFAFRPVLSRTSVTGMALLAAISPTLLFASRSINPAIVIGFFGVLAMVSVTRAGFNGGNGAALWAGVLGASAAAMIATGPDGITAIIAIGAGLAVGAATDARQGEDRHHGPISAGFGAIMGKPIAGISLLTSFVVASLLLFSRFLSSAASLEGFLTTFSTWGKAMATQTSTTPTQFFFYATLLYEILAIVFAIVAVSTSGRTRANDDSPRLQPTVFVVWFAVALVLHSLASGRQPDDLALVTLPLVLLGGIGLGRLFDRIPWHGLISTRDGLILVAMFGLFFGLIGVITLAARANDPGQAANRPWLRVLFIFLIVVIPLGLLVFREATSARYPRFAGWCALLVVAVLLGVFTIRSATQLTWIRGDTGTELAAQEVPTEGLRAFVDQTLRLSRDLSLTEVSNVDNTGSYGISIAVDPSIEWPFAWYFRDFQDLRVTSPAGWSDADMVIAPTKEGMEDAGYVVQSRTWLNRVPASYEDLGLGSILDRVVSPSMWYDSMRFLFYRDLTTATDPEQVSVGYTFRLANQMNPSAGPFDLDTGQSLGPGSALGQLMAPTGIALSNDGQVIYIVDSGNQRIQRFSSDGTFIGSWSAEDNQRIGLGMLTTANQGASDIVVGPDDLIYVADTWNHRILVLDADGNLVREFGRSGEVTDNMDSPDPTVQPGLFYGPRSIAVAPNGEIYVTDTGNERVQVFASDGTFLRAFGGWGSEPGKLLEPVGIAIGPDGNVYVADTGNARLSVFAADGTPVTQIPVPNWANQFSQQDYLRFGADGILYLTSPGSGVVQAWNGAEFVTIQGGEAGGSVTAPVGLAIAPDGTMLVTETQTSKVIQFPVALPQGFVAQPGATPQASPQATAASPAAVTPTPTPEGVG